jgi:hypothetical protein
VVRRTHRASQVEVEKQDEFNKRLRMINSWYQSVQEEEAAAEYVPAAQGLQAALDCVSLPWLPAGQA